MKLRNPMTVAAKAEVAGAGYLCDLIVQFQRSEERFQDHVSNGGRGQKREAVHSKVSSESVE